MHSHELLREVIQKCSAKQIAADMGLSVSMIYKWAEPSDTEAGSGALNPLDRIAELQKSTKDPRIAQWVCSQAGGFFVKNPDKIRENHETLLPVTNMIVQEFADLLGVIAVAVADNQVNRTESSDIRKKWEELKTVTEEFVVCCEQGTFNKIPTRAKAQGSPSSRQSSPNP
jgi:hypothetical protein